MVNSRTVRARQQAGDSPRRFQAPRAASNCRWGSPLNTGFALTLLVLGGILPAAGFFPVRPAVASADPVSTRYFDQILDRDGNGIEDCLDRWHAGTESWAEIRRVSSWRPAAGNLLPQDEESGRALKSALPGGIWAEGGVRVLCLGAGAEDLASTQKAAAAAGRCRVLHSLDRWGGVSVLAVDRAGLSVLLERHGDYRLLLDRDGVPALDRSRILVGADQAAVGTWQPGDDGSASVAILDSGCDTAHGDLGDYYDDDRDGPAPEVGDATDWVDAQEGWPVADRYKVVGWRDVTDDFPEAQGPWDYHHHGTALASVVAGAAVVNPDLHGVAPGARLTVVKFYDFDEVWHAWAGDFLAACAWTLDNLEAYRIRSVLVAVNWADDAGIGTAMSAFLDAGVLPVAAMGNFGEAGAGPGYPAALPEVLTVGAVNDDGAVAAYSGRGRPGTSKPDLLAPGGGLYQSGGRIEACDNEPNDTYSGRVGTSLAAAHVAGVVYLADEVLRKTGVVLPRDREAVLTRTAVLKTTAFRVDTAEDETGTGTIGLDPGATPDRIRGWGLVRVDAAIAALQDPLLPGQDRIDTLGTAWGRPVIARKLVFGSGGMRMLVEAVPSSGLDIALCLVDPRWLDRDPDGTQILRQDINQAGVSEFAYLRPDAERWYYLVVHRVSGSGTVTMKVREAGETPAMSARKSLAGAISADPNWGKLAPYPGPSLVIPSAVTLDPEIRSLSVLDPMGEFRLNWPVFLFPHPSSQGGLSRPLVWDLDAVEGDEIVVASDYGSLYFFTGDGVAQEVGLEFNLALTAPVGLVAASGEHRVVTVDRNGQAFCYAAGPVLRWNGILPAGQPLAPAAGMLDGGGGEDLVVAFADGTVTALDADGNQLPGWPRDLAAELTQPPVLCDVDEDGFHEVILPVLDEASGTLAMRVLRGDGSPGPGDGVVVPAPEGGSWRVLSSPLVVGRYGTGELRVSVAGLTDNGLSGADARLVLGMGSLFASGAPLSEVLPGLAVRATTDVGVLTIDHAVLAGPVGWNLSGGTGIDPQVLLAIRWREVLYGLTSIPGAAAGWFGLTGDGRSLAGRRECFRAGPQAELPEVARSLVMPLDAEVHLRVQILDSEVELIPVTTGDGAVPLWSSRRADSRNSGAFPLNTDVSAVGPALGSVGLLRAYPNPGPGRFRFRWDGLDSAVDCRLEIFDLRGRRVRRLEPTAGGGLPVWDGTDRRGRNLAAGTYLVRARSKGFEAVTRLVLQR